MNKYIVLEIGKSAYTEFKMKNDEFEETQDSIVVDEIEANSKKDGYNKVINSKQHKNKKFNNLIVKQIV